MLWFSAAAQEGSLLPIAHTEKPSPRPRQHDAIALHPGARRQHRGPREHPQPRAREPALIVRANRRRRISLRPGNAERIERAEQDHLERRSVAQRALLASQQGDALRVVVLARLGHQLRARQVGGEAAQEREVARRPLELQTERRAREQPARFALARRGIERQLRGPERAERGARAAVRLVARAARDDLQRAPERARAQLRPEHAAMDDQLRDQLRRDLRQVERAPARPVQRNPVEQHQRLVGRGAAQGERRALQRSAQGAHGGARRGREQLGDALLLAREALDVDRGARARRRRLLARDRDLHRLADRLLLAATQLRAGTARGARHPSIAPPPSITRHASIASTARSPASPRIAAEAAPPPTQPHPRARKAASSRSAAAMVARPDRARCDGT